MKKNYKLAKIEIQKEKAKPKYTVTECLKDYSRGGRKKEDIINLANNSVENALKLMAMGAALEQAKQKIRNKKVL